MNKLSKTLAIMLSLIMFLFMIACLWMYIDWKSMPMVPIIKIVEKPIYIKEEIIREVKVSALDWQLFEVTSYTQHDEGVNNITSIGINLDKSWVNYFNIVAVDPSLVPYGSIVIIRLENGELLSGIAGDCGGAIKGKKLDLYVDSLDEAFSFGRQELEVAIITN